MRPFFIAASTRFLRSDKMFGNMEGHAESRDGKRKRQSAVQEVAEIFVDFEECHGTVPLLVGAQIRCETIRMVMPINGRAKGIAIAACRKLLRVSSLLKMDMGAAPRWCRRDWRRAIDRMFGARVG